MSDRCPLGYLFSVAIDLTLFKLADKEEMYNIILDVFEFWLDWTTENRVTCPCLDYPKNTFTWWRTIKNIFMTYWLSGERSLPFGLLVFCCCFFQIVFNIHKLIGSISSKVKNLE